METLRTSLLLLHVISGFVALVAGTIAAFLRKRRGFHSIIGSVFTKAMYVVAVTGIPLSILRGNMFLLGVSIFTLYMVISGSRAFRGMSLKQTLALSISGWIGAMALLVIGFSGLWIYQNTMAIVPVVFGFLLLTMALRDWRAYRGIKIPNPLSVHMNQMGGALIAAYTAFLTTGAGRLFESLGLEFQGLQVVVWLLPTVIGSVLLTLANIRASRV